MCVLHFATSVTFAFFTMEVTQEVCSVCKRGDGRTVLFCDGKTVSGEQCKSVYCFGCAGVSCAPPGEWFCGSCKVKRGASSLVSTPQQAKKVHAGKSTRVRT